MVAAHESTALPYTCRTPTLTVPRPLHLHCSDALLQGAHVPVLPWTSVLGCGIDFRIVLLGEVRASRHGYTSPDLALRPFADGWSTQ